MPDRYTFLSGHPHPVPSSTADAPSHTVADLPTCPLSRFLERKVRARALDLGFHDGTHRTLSVRVVSDNHRSYSVPDVIRRHFALATPAGPAPVPPTVSYRSRTLLLFQTHDDADVCLFCMYVHEYAGQTSPRDRRAYVAYLDSADHCRPKALRGALYREVLVAYLCHAKHTGHAALHLWSCPPTRGSAFVFWAHPPHQRTPGKERLGAWYDAALGRAATLGAVGSVCSLHDVCFRGTGDGTGPCPCPPILEGDFWIEEATRVHRASMRRHLKSGVRRRAAPTETGAGAEVLEVLLQRLAVAPQAAPFARPVNVVALKLLDYYEVVARPMDLGTVQVRCSLGEFATVGELVGEVRLVFDNARKYNPPGHVVHQLAHEVEGMFRDQLQELVQEWRRKYCQGVEGMQEVEDFYGVSLRLGQSIGRQVGALVGRDYTPPPLEMQLVNHVSPSKASIMAAPHALLSPSPTRILELGASPSPSPSPPSAAEVCSPSPLAPLHRPDHYRPCTPPPAPPAGPGRKKIKRPPPPVFSLFRDGAPAVAQRMAGAEPPPAAPKSHKKKKHKKDSSLAPTAGGPRPPVGPRRGSWLGEEVGQAVGSMRASFYVCGLGPGEEGAEGEAAFRRYMGAVEEDGPAQSPAGGIMDLRQNFLELSQHRHYQFDTLRRAKHSSVLLLRHLTQPGTDDLRVWCTACAVPVGEVWWQSPRDRDMELCGACHAREGGGADEFVPHRNYSLSFVRER